MVGITAKFIVRRESTVMKNGGSTTCPSGEMAR
jgi:hypothetical protein